MATKETKNVGVSLDPAAMYEGGGLVDDLDAVIEGAAFVMFDYGGKAPIPIPAAHFHLVGEDGETRDQYWSIGKDFAPSDDGGTLRATGTSTSLNKGSNFGILMASIVEAGFPPNRLTDSIKVLEGMKCHFSRVAAPKRGTVKAPRADGKVYDDTILVISKIHQLPWEAKPGKKGTTTPKGKASGGDPSMDEELMEVVQGILVEKGGEITRQQLAAAAFAALKENPNRNAMVKRVYEDEFLGNGPWSYEKGVVSLG